jgi:hypothetical protein
MQVPLLVENHKVRAQTENGHSNQSIINLHHHLSSYYLTLTLRFSHNLEIILTVFRHYLSLDTISGFDIMIL